MCDNLRYAYDKYPPPNWYDGCDVAKGQPLNMQYIDDLCKYAS